MSMLQNSVIRNQVQDESLIASRWAKYQNFLAKVDAIKSFKEEIYQDGFLHDVFENCLGYTLKTTNPSQFNLDREQKNEIDGKKADGAIYVDNKIVGVIELKDQKSKNLDAIEAQAFGYHTSHSYNRYIIISNFDELRFYIDKKTTYEKFYLFSLTYDEFKKLHLILSFESISSGLTLKLKDLSSSFEQNISKKLYSDFNTFRKQLFENIVKNNYVSVDEASDVIPAEAGIHSVDPRVTHEDDRLLDKQTLLRLTQKLCDRLIFILFAEDRGLLRANTIREIREHFKNQAFTSFALYDIYKFYFDAIGNGNDKLDIQKYNGGLFAKDEILDNLLIDDECIDITAQKLSDYDFESDISVNILGHIFEQSLTDLEEMERGFHDSVIPAKAGIHEEEWIPASSTSMTKTIDNDNKKVSKRKKDGVFYTPEYITKYIVENTLGKLCEDKKSELGIMEIEPPKDSRKPTKKEQITKEALETYRAWLLQLKILDPACGSGAFLNQALEFLIREHKGLQANLAIMGDITAYYEIETAILEHNLYGVDINEDAVEIAKLSLWLRTASKGRTLTNLSERIVCANSLLDMPFLENSFDVVIGNPPYVRQEAIKEIKPQLQEKYETYTGTADLFVYFYELGIRMLKPNGLKGFICSNKFFRAKYGENLRKYILENISIEEIADFNGVKVFEDATVDSVITVFKKQKPNKHHQFKVVDTDLENYTFMKQSDLTTQSFTFSNPAELVIKQKIESVGTPLKNWDINIYRGITTGCNEAFVVDSQVKEEYIKLDSKCSSLIKPLLRGRILDKYESNLPIEYLLYIPWTYEFDDNQLIKNHLLNFEKILSSRPEVLQGRFPWYAMSRYGSAYANSFDNPKIIYPEFSSSPLFSYDDNGSYLLDTGWFIDKGDKYLLACLNSKLIWHYLGSISSSLGSASLRMKKIFVEQIPIPKIEEEKQQPFIKLVDEILEAKEKIKKYKKHFDALNAVDKIEITEEIEKLELRVTECEREIDNMVYKLYELTDEEIKVVEGNDGI